MLFGLYLLFVYYMYCMCAIIWQFIFESSFLLLFQINFDWTVAFGHPTPIKCSILMSMLLLMMFVCYMDVFLFSLAMCYVCLIYVHIRNEMQLQQNKGRKVSPTRFILIVR